MVKSQELIIKKIEELCVRLVQNYKERDKKHNEWKIETSNKYGFNYNEEAESEGKRLYEKYRKLESDTYKEIKDWILKDLTLWELNLDGNICPVPGISIDTYGASGGYVLTGYKPGTRYILLYQ